MAARAELESKAGVSVWDGQVPDDLIGAIFLRQAAVSRVFASLPVRPRFNQPTGELFMLDGLGLLRPADVIAEARSRPGPVRDCGYGVEASRDQRIPLDHVAGARPQVIRIGYYAARSVPGTVTADLKATRVVFQQGLHYVFVVVEGPVAQLSLRLDPSTPGAGICATDIVVGQPWPKPGS